MESFFKASGYERSNYLDFFLGEAIDKTIEESLAVLRQTDSMYESDLTDWREIFCKLLESAPHDQVMEMEAYSMDLRKEERHHAFLLGFFIALETADLVKAPTPHP